MVMQYSEQSAGIEDTYEVLTEGSTYAGVVGLMAGAFIGGLLTFVPFGQGGVGSVLRTLGTAAAGGYLIVSSRSRFDNYGKGMNYAGTVLVLSSVVQAATIVSPSFGKKIGVYSAEEYLPQSGSGNVIGQETAYHSYSDIKNAEELTEGSSGFPGDGGPDWDFENMTVDMVRRVPASDAVASVVELSPLGHGPDQWFGSEFSPTGGVDQNFGGISESSASMNPTDLSAEDYVSSVDTLGLRAQNMNKSNLFVTTHYAGGSNYAPPVHHQAEEPMIEQTASANVQSPEYFKPFTTADTDMNPLASIRVVSPGGQTPIQWYGSAEQNSAGQLGRYTAEGNGSIVGQM
jgi:hypothetical protein|tara:strand:+ start:2869 stop:3903 length:1035 start_codon:yes stop_codon:yes gene_type:complete